MNTFIEIFDANTTESGVYKVWYYENKEKKCRLLDENHVNALLDMDQKSDFFAGKYRFKIRDPYDFRTIILEGQKRKGL